MASFFQAQRQQTGRCLLLLSRAVAAQQCSGGARGAACASSSAAAAAVAAGNVQLIALRAWGTASSCRPWQQHWRHFSTITATQAVLDGVAAARLHEELREEGERRPFMPYQELVHLIIDRGCAKNVPEAQQRAEALTAAGVVLQFNGMVYLRPHDVTELVYKLLPADPAAAQDTLTLVEQELAKMDKQHQQIYSRAQRWPRRWLYAGCAALAVQLVGFSYLIWWELSWDVMEPIAYITSVSYSLIAYVYFLATRTPCEQKEFVEYWEQQQLEKTMAAAGFSLDKYQNLIHARDRYKRYLASAGSLNADVLAAYAAEAASGVQQQQVQQQQQGQQKQPPPPGTPKAKAS